VEELQNVIAPTGFSVVPEPGIQPCVPKPSNFEIPHIPPEAEPQTYFEATLPQRFFEHLETITNLRRRDCPTGILTVQAIRKWLGLTIIFMVLGLRNIDDLFSTQNIVINFPNKKYSLPKRVWKWINSHLEFDEEILRIILIKSWQYHLIPGTFVGVDETRIHCHPRDISSLSLNRNKPDRWAKESHTVNDCQTNFLLNFDLPKQQSSFQALHTLTAFLKGRKKHHITADNHFGNIPQAELLDQNGFYCTLNCKGNAQPSLLWKGGLGCGLPKFRSRWAKKGNLVVATFHSNAKVNLVSNFYTVNELSRSVGKDRGVLLQHYDNTKRAADKFNLMVKKFHNPHPHLSEMHTLLNRWLEWGLTNGYILHKHNTKIPLTHREYLMYISNYLLQ